MNRFSFLRASLAVIFSPELLSRFVPQAKARPEFVITRYSAGVEVEIEVTIYDTRTSIGDNCIVTFGAGS